MNLAIIGAITDYDHFFLWPLKKAYFIFFILYSFFVNKNSNSIRYKCTKFREKYAKEKILVHLIKIDKGKGKREKVCISKRKKRKENNSFKEKTISLEVI